MQSYTSHNVHLVWTIPLNQLCVCLLFRVGVQRFVRVLFQDDLRSAVRTLLWKAGENVDALAQTCAGLFGVTEPQHYCLFWRSDGEMCPLPAHAQPHQLAAHEGVSLSYLRRDHDFSKNAQTDQRGRRRSGRVGVRGVKRRRCRLWLLHLYVLTRIYGCHKVFECCVRVQLYGWWWLFPCVVCNQHNSI